jgi:hypothetical protein
MKTKETYPERVAQVRLDYLLFMKPFQPIKPFDSLFPVLKYAKDDIFQHWAIVCRG